MFSRPRSAALRLISRYCRCNHELLPRTLYRRQYATADASSVSIPARRYQRNSPDWRETQRLEKLLKNMTSDSQGVEFGRGTNDYFYFEHLALRDRCQCSKCVDSSTKQRHFTFADIPSDIQGQCHVRQDGQLEVKWTNDIPGFEDDHISVFSMQELLAARNRASRAESHHERYNIELWDAQKLKKERQELKFKYSRFTDPNEDALRARAVAKLLQWGLIFITGVPSETDSVVKMLNVVGPIRNTFYGETWDVRSVSDAQNVAYTSRDLGFHQDLLYMADPPGLQALHMIKASSTGGESLFTDGMRAVQDLWQQTPQHRGILTNFHVTYRYQNAGEWYEYSRPTLEGYDPLRHRNARVQFKYLNWSPPFQGPFALDRGYENKKFHERENRSYLHQYREAAADLRKRFEAPEAVYETRMQPGTCVIFNNRRILHARKAFPVGGGGVAEERWLRGAYADLDPLMSRYRMARLRYAERDLKGMASDASDETEPEDAPEDAPENAPESTLRTIQFAETARSFRKHK